MNIEEIIYNEEIYYYINEYEFKYGKFYKFGNSRNIIFCTKENNVFNVITSNKLLKKLYKEFSEIEIKDIV